MAEKGQAELDRILEKVKEIPRNGYEVFMAIHYLEKAIEDFKEKFNCTMKSDQPGGGKKRRKRRTKKRRTKRRKSQRKSNKR